MTIVYLASFLQWMFAELLFNKLQCAHVLTLDKKETYKGSSTVWDFGVEMLAGKVLGRSCSLKRLLLANTRLL